MRGDRRTRRAIHPIRTPILRLARRSIDKHDASDTYLCPFTRLNESAARERFFKATHDVLYRPIGSASVLKALDGEHGVADSSAWRAPMGSQSGYESTAAWPASRPSQHQRHTQVPQTKPRVPNPLQHRLAYANIRANGAGNLRRIAGTTPSSGRRPGRCAAQLLHNRTVLGFATKLRKTRSPS